jgi:hypothetical protein
VTAKLAPTLTVNRACSRCPRIEQTEVSVEDIVKMATTNKSQGGKAAIPEGPKALLVRVNEKQTIEFPFLCTPCTQIVSRYIEHIAKRPKHQSALRGETKIEVEEGD